MTELPSGLRGRILALAIALAVLLILWLGIVRPVFGWYRQGEVLLTQQQMLAQHMANVISQIPTLQRQAEAVTARRRKVQVLLPGATDALASAGLQARLTSMAHDSGASLVSAETLPVQNAGSYRRIALRLSVNGSWPQLVALFTAIEQSAPALLVDDLQMHAGAMQPGRGGHGSLPNVIAAIEQSGSSSGGRLNTPPIMAVFTVFGLRAGDNVAPEQAEQPSSPAVGQ